jgi:hypothetical protein
MAGESLNHPLCLFLALFRSEGGKKARPATKIFLASQSGWIYYSIINIQEVYL